MEKYGDFAVLVLKSTISVNESLDTLLWDRIFVLSLRMHTDTTSA